MEILFEQDNEEKSVATLILDTLVKVQMEYNSKKEWIYTVQLWDRIDMTWSLMTLLESFIVFGRRNAITYFLLHKEVDCEVWRCVVATATLGRSHVF